MLCSVYTHFLWACTDGVPLLGSLRTSAVAGAFACDGGDRHLLTDRPRPSFRQRPAKSTAFLKARMPFTVTTREGLVAKGLLPPAFAPALSLTPPTRFLEEERVFEGHCKNQGAVTRGPWQLLLGSSRVQTPFLLVGTAVPGTDDPSTPSSSTGPAVDED